jgi:hypothetical protein
VVLAESFYRALRNHPVLVLETAIRQFRAPLPSASSYAKRIIETVQLIRTPPEDPPDSEGMAVASVSRLGILTGELPERVYPLVVQAARQHLNCAIKLRVAAGRIAYVERHRNCRVNTASL